MTAGQLASAEPSGGYGGYRLASLELRNWGTFDRDLFVVQPNGQPTLLVGQNGSGKSTLVDAILMLLVKPGIRNFNVAAGARKTERDERSYLKGAYDRTEDEEGHVLVKYLRPAPKGYSVILACFQTAGGEKSFTLAQVLYLGSDQAVEKIYCFADSARSAQDSLPLEEPPDRILRSLRAAGWKATKTFTEYESWLLAKVRAKPKATEVLNQTVAVKDIQRLNDFIRQHMLESQPWHEKVDRLLGHFAQLREAHTALVRVRTQQELLQPVARLGERYRESADALGAAEKMLDATEAYFFERIIGAVEPEQARIASELSAVRERVARVDRDSRDLQARWRSLENQIVNAGGPRLAELPLLIQAEAVQRDMKRQTRVRLEEGLKRCDLPGVVSDAATFAEAFRSVSLLKAKHQDTVSTATQRVEPLIVERAATQAEAADGNRELTSLRGRRENLPEWCVSLRGTMCTRLGVPVKDVPFAAELIAVSSTEREWESSIEKALRGLGLSLLVPERYYNIITGYVEATRLADAQGRGKRLRYLQVGARQPSGAGSVSPHSIVRKLSFREGHPLVPWVIQEVQDRHDFRCCDTMEEFRESRGRAMTRSRHFKFGDHRHEKDDTDFASDPRDYVLGWDNRDKVRRLSERLQELASREQVLGQMIRAIEIERQNAQTSLGLIAELERISTFDEVDPHRHETQMASLQKERAEIEGRSQTVQDLRTRVTSVEAQIGQLQNERDDLVRRDEQLEQSAREAALLLRNAQTYLKSATDNGTLAVYSESFSAIAASCETQPTNAFELVELKERFRADLGNRTRRLREELDPLKGDLVEAMAEYMRRCPGEHDIRANIEYLPAFLALRQRILEDDLPRHEQRFKERLNERVIQEIGLFRADLERERRAIQEKIEALNQSLRRLRYRPGTYIQLDPRPIRDVEVVEFQSRLRECIEGSFDDTPEGNEARFVRIQALLERLQDENNRRWRDKVTDVRRWFDFAAAVVDHESGRTESIYHDSSGQSGGEKAKLAFTILVAAIAYQYDIDPERPMRERLQFVVVDEMFSKVDDQHAEFALDLFKEFGLQVLIVAPLDAKARVTQPYVGCYLHVSKQDNRSEIFQLTAQEFEETVRGSVAQPPIQTIEA